jgi:nickel/cobalt transporter (NicO) family protein
MSAPVPAEAGVLAAIAVTAVTVGSLHSLAPDHWLPFAAIARSQRWSAARTARVTVACGFGHVTASVLAGLLALGFGLELVAAFGHRLESWGGILLVVFGLGYGLWGLRRAAGRRLHGHAHRHYDHVHKTSRATPWTLFLLASADPCVAVVPLIVAAAPLGAGAVAGVAVVYEVATIATMTALVLLARRGAVAVRSRWLDRYGDVAAGALIAALGAVLTALGA